MISERRLGSIAAAIALVVLCTAQSSWSQEIPKLTSYVNDLAGVMSASERAALDLDLRRYRDSTSNQFVVLTVPSLDGYPIEEYANEVARANGIGTAENDNGLLFVAAIEDRKMRFEVGYGLEGAIPDAIARRIIENEIRPRFQLEDYDGGIRAAMQAAMLAAAGEYRAEPAGETAEGFGLGGIILLIILFLFISRLFRRRRPRGPFGGGGGGGLLPWIIASQSSGWGGGWSSGSSGGGGWSSGGDSGGFSGGGGDFGGGGASGSW